MVKIIYIDQDGGRQEVDATAGTSVMQAALNAGIAAIEGECGGAGACATCHVYIPEPWQMLTGAAHEDEAMMLEFGVDTDQRSRLGCQIRITPEMTGLTVLTPRSQR